MTPNNAKLEALVGQPRRAEPTADDGRDAVRLIAIVNSATVNSSPTLASSGFLTTTKQKRMRGYRRTDWLNVGAGVVAVVIAVGAATFTGVQMASASPTAGAVQILTTDETALAGAEQAAIASKSRLEEGIQTGITDAANLRGVLDSLAATDVRAATADPAALNTVIQSVDAYAVALGDVAVPTLPAPYERGSVDTESLEGVGEAIDRVQEVSRGVDAAAEELRAARTDVDSLTTAYTTQLASFAASFTGHAQAEVEAYPVAGQGFRDAVVAAAASIVGTPLNTPSGATALSAYRDAVIALHDDDYRARLAEEAARNSQQQNNNVNNPPTTETPTEPDTDPGTDISTDQIDDGGPPEP